MPKTAKTVVITLLLGVAALGAANAAPAAHRPQGAVTVSADAAPPADHQPGDMTWG